MAEKEVKKNTGKKSSGKKAVSTIDPVYQKFSKSVVKTLMSTDFYEYFMATMESGKKQFQFSNRKVEKIVDLNWVDFIEDCLESFQIIISNPRNIIKEEEIIVNVAHAKKSGADVVRHLAQHSNYVEHFDDMTGDVRPSKLMQKMREDSTALYENRVLYTTLEAAYRFVTVRYDALMANMSDEMGAKLNVRSDFENPTEDVHFDMTIHIKQKEDALSVDARNREVFSRIARIQRLLGYYLTMPFMQAMSKEQRVKGNLNKTNVLKKHPEYKKIVALYEFLRQYDQAGYLIKIKEQNPEISEEFEQNIYHNILFNYIALKGYLEDAKDREIPVIGKDRKKVIKPKIILKIIEELVEDYDLRDVEVRKIIIDELTKEQLKYEEEQKRQILIRDAEETRRKIEEQMRLEKLRGKEEAKRKREEEERIRRQKKQEAAEKVQQNELLQKSEDRRRTKPILDEYNKVFSQIASKTLQRSELIEEIQQYPKQESFADFVYNMEQAERIKAEEQEKLEQQRAEEKLRKANERKEKLRMQRIEERLIQREADEYTISAIREELAVFLQFCMLQKEKRINADINVNE